ncbi:alpha/beta hydrolase [Roseovarius salinarum]|uniref:alpha/beta hydrolase n=1 Tax=Roseovarius salinarum TaxID=1981892 RepID=UPI001E29851F|nr:alpha/beta fold hydrolase [Roseovarius salinarum]
MALAFLVAACAPPRIAKLATPDPAAQVQSLFVATERRLDQVGRIFGQDRSTEMHYARVDVSVPPVHEPGRIEWPDRGQPADPARHFAVTDYVVHDRVGSFRQALRARRDGTETMVYVHGYNNTLSEAMYRLAQIRADFEPPMPSVLFSWPSAGDPRGYIYDRDSVLFARDDLKALLGDLTAGQGEKVFLLAHSMGAHLVMEVLRQAAIAGDRRLLNRISGVVLMSPDIDPDLFRRQAEAIGDLPQPFLIFISERDRVLNLAALITGRKPRLGGITDPAEVAGLDVQVVDFTALSEDNAANHAVPVTSPAAISVLRGMIEQAARNATGFEEYMLLPAQP